MNFILSLKLNEHDSLLSDKRYSPIDNISEDNYIALRQQQKELSALFDNQRKQQLVSGERKVLFVPEKPSTND